MYLYNYNYLKVSIIVQVDNFKKYFELFLLSIKKESTDFFQIKYFLFF